MKTYQINIEHATFKITHDRLVKTLPHGINQLKNEYKDEVEWNSLTSYPIDSSKLKNMIAGYSEQLTPYAEEDMVEWFSYTSGRMFKTDYPDLFYFAEKPYEANKSSVAAIGEGIAGYVMTNIFGYDTLARPIGDSPDILMEKDGKIAFVEAKASISHKGKKSLENIIKDAAIGVLELIAKAQYSSPEYVGFIIGTEIHDSSFDVSVLELTYNVSSSSSAIHYLKSSSQSVKTSPKSPYDYKGLKDFSQANRILADIIHKRTESLEEIDKSYDFINELLLIDIYKNAIMQYVSFHLLEDMQSEKHITADEIVFRVKRKVIESFANYPYISDNLKNHDSEIIKKVERMLKYLKKSC